MRGLGTVSSSKEVTDIYLHAFPAWSSTQQPGSVSVAASVVVDPSKGSCGFLLLKEAQGSTITYSAFTSVTCTSELCIVTAA